MNVGCYLVLGQHQTTGKITVRRAVSRYPGLDYNEAVVELVLQVPDDIFEAPLVVVEATHRDIAVVGEAVAHEGD